MTQGEPHSTSEAFRAAKDDILRLLAPAAREGTESAALSVRRRSPPS